MALYKVISDARLGEGPNNVPITVTAGQIIEFDGPPKNYLIGGINIAGVPYKTLWVPITNLKLVTPSSNPTHDTKPAPAIFSGRNILIAAAVVTVIVVIIKIAKK